MEINGNASESRSWFSRLLDWLYPPVCPGCGANGYGFCKSCRARIIPWGENLGDELSIYAGGVYEKELRSAVLQTKLLGHTYLVDALADVMLAALPAHLLHTYPVAVVPLPPARQRLKRRGYHCPWLLAQALVKRVGNFGYCPGLLHLVRPTAEQKKLSRSERFANVEGAYEANAARDISVLLVDDVLTTGASAWSASRALYAAGAAKVDVAVVGRAYKR